MRGRRSSRSAAVVLAGCVGLAVMAPGLALAADPLPSTDAECVAAYGAGFVVDTTATTGCAKAPATSTTTSTTSPSTTGTGNEESTGTQGGGDTAGTPAGGNTRTGTGNTQTEDTGNTGPTADEGSTGNVGGQEAQQRRLAGPEEPISAAAVTNNIETLQSEVNQTLALPELPLVDLLPLPDLPDIPLPDAGGNFENVNDACLNAISQLQFPAGTEGLDVLSEQLQGFCTTLDPTNLTDLLDSLLELLNGLIPSLPTPTNPIPDTPPASVPAEYWGYWNKQYDVDCPELTYDEANAILAGDPSDPFNLDGNDDGEACEGNRYGTRVRDVEYIGYPVGGVATGDGSTDSGASGVEVALAAGVLSGLGVTGLALVRRFARQG